MLYVAIFIALYTTHCNCNDLKNESKYRSIRFGVTQRDSIVFHVSRKNHTREQIVNKLFTIDLDNIYCDFIVDIFYRFIQKNINHDRVIESNTVKPFSTRTEQKRRQPILATKKAA